MVINIEEKVREILSSCEIINVPVAEVGSEADLLKIGMNSINLIKMIVVLESEFEITFDDEMLSAKKFNNINGLVDYIKNSITSGEV